jgi:hypothetical protein
MNMRMNTNTPTSIPTSMRAKRTATNISIPTPTATITNTATRTNTKENRPTTTTGMAAIMAPTITTIRIMGKRPTTTAMINLDQTRDGIPLEAERRQVRAERGIERTAGRGTHHGQ